MGWFFVSKEHTEPTEEIVKYQKQLLEFDEAPLLLLIQPGSSNQQLPVHVYEPINEGGDVKYREATVVIETGEAERVAVEDLVRESNAHAAGERLRQHLVSQHAAVKILNGRVQTVLDYIKGVNEGTVKPDHRILRSLRSILSQLGGSSGSKDEATLQEAHALTAALLATVSQGAQLTVDLKSKGFLLDAPVKKSRRRGGLPDRGARESHFMASKKWDIDTDEDMD